MPENTKAKVTDGTYDRNIYIFMNHVVYFSVLWAGVHPNLPITIIKILHVPCLFVWKKKKLAIVARDSWINMYSSLQLFWKFFLFDPTSKNIPACRSGF